MYKIFAIIYFVFYLPLAVFSQTLTLKAIATGGDFAQSDDFTISYTIGECAIQTSPQIGVVQFTEGFQQGEIIIKPDTLPVIIVYPNPVSNYPDGKLHVNLPYNDKIANYTIMVYSLQGRIMEHINVNTSDGCKIKPLNFRQYPTGLYFVKIQSSDGLVARTFKVEKK